MPLVIVINASIHFIHRRCPPPSHPVYFQLSLFSVPLVCLTGYFMKYIIWRSIHKKWFMTPRHSVTVVTGG